MTMVVLPYNTVMSCLQILATVLHTERRGEADRQRGIPIQADVRGT